MDGLSVTHSHLKEEAGRPADALGQALCCEVCSGLSI